MATICLFSLVVSDHRLNRIREARREVLLRMGLALLFVQTTEHLIETCLTYMFSEGGVLTLEMLLRSGQKKRTLGQFLTKLRKRVDLDEILT
jgi:hypothetical protein